MKNPVPTTRATRGFAMMEVLVTIFMLGVGMLGVAGLQAVTLRSNQSAHLRSAATNLVYEMAERMRANKAGIIAGLYDAIDTESLTGSKPDCSKKCTSVELSNYDAFEWKTAIESMLPDGSGTVQANATVQRYTVTVSWQYRSRDPANPVQPMHVSLEVQP